MLGETDERILKAYNQLFEDMLKDESSGEELIRRQEKEVQNDSATSKKGSPPVTKFSHLRLRGITHDP